MADKNKYPHPDNRKVKEKLRKGDATTIADVTGFSFDYVNKILEGKRHNDKVITAANTIITQREELKNSIL